MRREIRAGTVTLQHIQTVTRGDRIYRYLRIPGQPPQKLPDLPLDHPDFLAAYAAGLRKAPQSIRAPAGTILSLIHI